MDLLVKLSGSSMVNVEIQQIGYAFPGERAGCYQSDLVMRQYNLVRSEMRKESDELRKEKELLRKGNDKLRKEIDQKDAIIALAIRSLRNQGRSDEEIREELGLEDLPL